MCIRDRSTGVFGLISWKHPALAEVVVAGQAMSGCQNTGGNMSHAFPFMANPHAGGNAAAQSKKTELTVIKKKLFNEMVTKRILHIQQKTEGDKKQSELLQNDARNHREQLDREREELKKMRVSRRAPNAPIASSDEEGEELLAALGKDGLYGGSKQRKESKLSLIHI
eukprot:TRINITY_DN2223_c0_g1_i1.p1 TRINITY_DN2223_c0_g1~~TRINITY_DN2223_c0_g1_i1.p1  ORF type:complete len:168 (-),score=73.48 TRINITY_DN2223_c0_g1_i1:129-632(-)